ncbi:hypothetical protein PENTCL1PPCAC_10773 [Pristionchus entomophagus]|uniref:PHD-type domain-containing protein n=1 Tax=Pristionchus entomophagus TaxID=358040 RepID=A0AAV5T327_9BILA|nr:hypothetical protein PENTCL1PPCAC_10773 [Pristionchus entomophagus]
MKKTHFPVYDDEVGFAHELEALLNPKGHKRSIPRYRAPAVKWKGVNAQFCIVCREGGEILCCEGCPASFHLLCHTPPILKSAIPSGKWFCHRCTVLPKEVSKTNILQNPDETETDRNEMATNYVLATATEEEKEDPLKLITHATSVRNTQNFTLPDDIDPKVPLPHTQLPRPRANLKGKNCTKCGMIVEGQPMIECDYCVSPYHLDCLDSPMTVPAKSRWMCPQHPELVVDKNLLTSNSLSERLALWEEHASTSDVDPLESQVRFVAKSREEAEEAEERGEGTREKRVRVPKAVKRLYRERAEVDDPEVFDSSHSRDEWVEEMVGMIASAASTHYSEGTSMEEEEMKGPSLKRECIRRLRGCKGKERLIYSLALDRIQSIEKETVVMEEKPVKPEIDQSCVQSDRLILAVLARESHPRAAVPIQKAVMSVGTAKEVDVRVESVCTNIAPNHASIVFDKVAQRFEILAAGVEMVRVDGIDYGIHVEGSPPRMERRNILEEVEEEEMEQDLEVKEEVKMEHSPSNESEPIDNSPRGAVVKEEEEEVLRGCTCHLRRREGRVSQAAQLKHGSIIEIGCERFVFASFF